MQATSPVQARARGATMSAHVLYGREHERARIHDALDRARAGRAAVLVVRGEAGVGKSALLEDAREQATDMAVLRGVGVESEAQLPYAGLHQLVRPILGELERLPAPQSAALQGALGLATGGNDDRFLVSLATLSLLAEAADRRPLLCLIDDAHWLDDASADALLFAARRLDVESIVMLFAAREGELRAFEAPGLPTLQLGGLDPAAAGALVDRHARGGLSPEVRDRLVAETEGNPLALLELASAMTSAQLSGADAVLAPIAINARVERTILAHVRRLREDTQTMLLVAAADDSGELAAVLRAAARLDVDAAALDAAEQAALVRVRADRLELRHPLVRSAIYYGAPLSKRRAVHRALAEAFHSEGEADRRAWHRALASVEPDASVVADLERAAQRARRRSGFAAASLALERAAALTDDQHERARRLIAAGEDAWQAGRPERARMLLERARPDAATPTERADIDRSLGLITMMVGVPADASELLVRAATGVAPLDGERALQLLILASVSSVYGGDREAAIAIARLVGELVVEDTPLSRTAVELLLGVGAYYEGDHARAVRHLRRGLAIEDESADDVFADQLYWVAFPGRAAVFLGDEQGVVRTTRRSATRARAGGRLGVLVHVLHRLGYGELWAGRWASASATAGEGLQLARELDQPHLVALQLVLGALIAAHRGDEDECRRAVAEGRGAAPTDELGFAAEVADWALTLLALGLDRPAEAFRRAREISRTFVVVWAALDRIEAAIRADERETARSWLASFEPWAVACDAAWARGVMLHCRALLADDLTDAVRLFGEALEAHAQAARPFERARTELAFGELLRRSRRRIEAREHLQAALVGFEALTATVWAERAKAELRASGQTASRRDPSTRDELSTQERQIARFVAQGLSNREVAAQLFLSPRTIDFHLRNVFRKLDITSRTQLARLELD